MEPEYPSTAINFDNLSELYQQQKQSALSGKQSQDKLAKPNASSQERLGEPEHPETVQSLNNMAILYHEQGKNDLAEPLLQRALSLSERQLGPKHPETVQSINNLAALYHEQGKDEACQAITATCPQYP